MNLIKISYLYIKKNIKLILILLFIVSIFNYYNLPNIEMTFDNKVLFYFSTNLYQLSIIIIISVFSFRFIKNFDNYMNIMLRFKNKKQYLLIITKIIYLNNTIIMIFSLLIGLIILLLSNINNVYFTQYEHYNIPFIIYNFFIFVKYYIITNNICIILTIIYSGFGNLITFIIMIILLSLKENYSYSMDIIDSLCKIKLFFGYYLYPFVYSDIFLELSAFSLEVIILRAIQEFILYYILKKKIYV